MRFWQISTFGIDSLEFAERPTPRPGPGEVLVKVRAISFNYRDLLMVKGLYNPKMRLPRVPCSDGAGEVAEVGEGVTSWKPGDRVAGIFMQNWLGGPPTPAKVKGALGGDVDGMLAEYVILKETGLVALPEHLSFEEGATLPCAAVTAWNALDAGNLDPRSTVLIQGTGGVSIFALQFAKLRGLRVLGISSSDAKLARARDLGLDAGLNYSENAGVGQMGAGRDVGRRCRISWSKWEAWERCPALFAHSRWAAWLRRLACSRGRPSRFLCPSSCTSRCASRASTLARDATLKR